MTFLASLSAWYEVCAVLEWTLRSVLFAVFRVFRVFVFHVGGMLGMPSRRC